MMIVFFFLSEEKQCHLSKSNYALNGKIVPPLVATAAIKALAGSLLHHCGDSLAS